MKDTLEWEVTYKRMDLEVALKVLRQAAVEGATHVILRVQRRENVTPRKKKR